MHAMLSLTSTMSSIMSAHLFSKLISVICSARITMPCHVATYIYGNTCALNKREGLRHRARMRLVVAYNKACPDELRMR